MSARWVVVLPAVLMLATACIRIDPVGGFSFTDENPSTPALRTDALRPAHVVAIEDPGGRDADVEILGYRLGTEGEPATLAPGRTVPISLWFFNRAPQVPVTDSWAAVPSMTLPSATFSGFSTSGSPTFLLYDAFSGKKQATFTSPALYLMLPVATPRSAQNLEVTLRVQRVHRATADERTISFAIPIVHPPEDFAIDKVTFDDAAPRGNGDGKPNPGEKPIVKVDLKNVGTGAAKGVTLALAVNDTHAGLGVWNPLPVSYGSIGMGEVVSPQEGFAIQIANTAPPGHSFTLKVTVTTSGGHSWDLAHAVTLSATSAE